jgi:hypothetical protein
MMDLEYTVFIILILNGILSLFPDKKMNRGLPKFVKTLKHKIGFNIKRTILKLATKPVVIEG